MERISKTIIISASCFILSATGLWAQTRHDCLINETSANAFAKLKTAVGDFGKAMGTTLKRAIAPRDIHKQITNYSGLKIQKAVITEKAKAKILEIELDASNEGVPQDKLLRIYESNESFGPPCADPQFATYNSKEKKYIFTLELPSEFNGQMSIRLFRASA